MKLPHLKHEVELWKNGFIVIGVDEVGRGAFAGPVSVGGVVFKPEIDDKYIQRLENFGINDSKKLKPNERKLLSKVIQKECLSYHISTIHVPQINRFGIGKATFSAMRDVVKNLREKMLSFEKGLSDRKVFVLVDAFYIKNLEGVGLKNQKGIIRGDGISLSIAAASIIAKVYRDNHMRRLSAKYPEYGWGKNKGYGSAFHRIALKNFGKTKLHRDDFVENFV